MNVTVKLLVLQCSSCLLHWGWLLALSPTTVFGFEALPRPLLFGHRAVGGFFYRNEDSNHRLTHRGKFAGICKNGTTNPSCSVQQTLTVCRGGAISLVTSSACTATIFSKSGLLLGWACAMGGFLVRNYKTATPWPSILLSGARRGWNFVHALASTLFAGTIIVTTLLEWLVVRAGSPSVLQFWFAVVPTLDVAVVVPALTVAMVSGVAQTVQEYKRVVEAPKYVKAVLHTLATFGLFWAATDRTTQHGAQQAVQTWLNAGAKGPLPPVLQWRRVSNVVSCAFVLALYGLMALKPGRPDLPPIR